jgi:hypothetical protein
MTRDGRVTPPVKPAGRLARKGGRGGPLHSGPRAPTGYPRQWTGEMPIRLALLRSAASALWPMAAS